MFDPFLGEVTWATRVAVIVLEFVLVVIVAAEVLFRCVVQQSLIFSDEVVRYLSI
jgi:TRAP-type C4-dicarboxylate transport system permease small subunit